MPKSDLVCFAHLRWSFTFQRPNHLMVRFASERRVFYVEEPVLSDTSPHIVTSKPLPNLAVCTPHVPAGTDETGLRALVQAFLTQQCVERPVVWMYTPMMLPLTGGLTVAALIYDCMDELSLFLHAPAELLDRERELLARADLVFTGGHSLYEAKREKHPRVYAFPSSVDVAHFQPLGDTPEPTDQLDIPQPRIGFFGVIDERMDIELLRRVSLERPRYHFVLVGPVVKIPESALPRSPNIHYLGAKTYAELPGYLAGWDVAIMPFALNDATRFISPTKTLEYLAAGKPVVSTAIRDVVRPYAELGVVLIAGKCDFASALDEALAGPTSTQLVKAAEVLQSTSWDATWSAMSQLVSEVEKAQNATGTKEPCLTT